MQKSDFLNLISSVQDLCSSKPRKFSKYPVYNCQSFALQLSVISQVGIFFLMFLNNLLTALKNHCLL